MLDMARNLVDPRTKQATAFYAALAVTIWDIARPGGGFHPINTAFLAALAGITVLGGLGTILKDKPPAQK